MNDLERYLSALWRDGDVREVRAPRWKGGMTAAGYFDDPAKLIAAVGDWDGKANLYLTVNPVQPALLSRAVNRINARMTTLTSDLDILERRWIYVDIDPVRPAGISSTEAESAAALATAREITAYLTDQDWPIPMVAMSGNGYALIVPIQLPNDQASTALVAGVLGHLAARFNNVAVTVDTTVSNAARIVALIGTMKVKGDHTPERPHRRATLLWVPEEFVPIPVERLAKLEPSAAPVNESGTGRMPQGWVRDMLDYAKVTYRDSQPDAAGNAWYGLKACPYHPDDGVEWQCGVGEAPDGRAIGKCFHNRGTGRTWQDFKRDLNLEVPPSGWVRINLDRNGTSPIGMDAADLLALDLPPLKWIVPGLIPEGTSILAAPPKVGKSCLIYQLSVEAAIGGTLLGRRVEPGSVLYLALEDGKRRGQERLRVALAGRTMPRGRLEIRWSCANIGKGLEEEIKAWLDLHPDALLVAIDTLGKVRPHSDGRRNAYEIDVEDMKRLQDLFRDRAVGLVIVHHLRKERDRDFLTAVSGSYGITGSADTTLVLKRKRLEVFGTVEVTGRDVADAEISVRFDGMIWSEAPEALSNASASRAAVYSVIEKAPAFAKAIAEKTGLERSNVQHMLEKLVDEGAAMRVATGYVKAPIPGVALNLPPNRVHSNSEDSVGGEYPARAYAPARGLDTTVHPDCADYQAHQSFHVQTSAGWTCSVCHPQGVAA